MRGVVIARFLVVVLAMSFIAPTLLFGQMEGGGAPPEGDRGGGRGGRGGRGGDFRRGRGGFRQRFGQPGMPGAPGTGIPGTDSPNAAPADGKPADGKTPDGKSADGEKKDGAKSAEPKPDAGPPPVLRPPGYDDPSLSRDQRLTVDDKRMVTSFNFQDAPWPFVLEELARISGMSLDWQQLPGDALNLRTNAKRTVVQARDMINEHLLARGYAILLDSKNSTMTVVSLDNVNTALVPRVAPEDLEHFQPHDLVKVSFRLDWMLADKAAQEFKAVLSPKAKILAMTTTNRLEVVDAVENLRQLAAILDEEQGQGNGDHLVKEFDLRYTRAPEVLEQLHAFLGVRKESANSSSNPQETQRQMFMQRMQMMSQQGGQQSGAAAAAAPPKPEVHLVAIQRRNSILVSAPPDQMAIIKAAIYKLDVPPDRSPVSENTAQTMRVYRLATADPEVVVNFLDAVGELDPQTKLDVDKKNRAVVAYANLRDQNTIASLVKNLDGTDRKLKVIQLRGLNATQVAVTLRTLLVGDEQSKTSTNNNGGSSMGFSPFGFGRGRRFGFGWGGGDTTQTTQNEESNAGKFRVDADAANNRLILWANKIELDQVEACLAELGEIGPRDRGGENVRFLDLGNGGEEQQFLDSLRRVWPSLGKDGNKLIIDVPGKKAEKESNQRGSTDPRPTVPKKEQTAPTESPRLAPAASKTAVSRNTESRPDSSFRTEYATARIVPLPIAEASITSTGHGQIGLAADNTLGNAPVRLAEADPGTSEPVPTPRRGRRRKGLDALEQGLPAPKAAPSNAGSAAGEKNVPGDPVFITRAPDGRLIIASRDAEALDTLQRLALRFGPQRKDYAVFYMKHNTAASVRYNLEEYFAGDAMGASRRTPDSSSAAGSAAGLSQQKPLRFIEDSQTNSLLVQGATPEQLRLIEDLIALYDRPEQPNAKASRMVRIFPIVHSKASVIADTIKEVYRDLLSANDKALDGGNQGRGAGRGQRVPLFDSNEDEGRISQSRFKGQLSIGVDETSNRLLVSCPESLMRNIEGIVQDLDHGAAPVEQTFQVLRIDRSIDAGVLEKKLMDMLKKPSSKTEQSQQSGAQPPAESSQQQQQQQQQQQRQRGGSRGQHSPEGTPNG